MSRKGRELLHHHYNNHWWTLQHVRKYRSEFHNSGGGTLCIGVRDDG